MLVAECNPLEINIRKPEKNKNSDSFIITVNHFSSKKMRKHDASNYNVYFAEVRYQTTYNAFKNIDCNDSIEYAKNILSGKYGFICQYDKELNFDVIWSSIFDITNGKVYRAEGNPLKTKYIEDERFSRYIKN